MNESEKCMSEKAAWLEALARLSLEGASPPGGKSEALNSDISGEGSGRKLDNCIDFFLENILRSQ